jgi:hypothetical protein
VVVAAIRDQRPRAASWAADPAADGKDAVEQFEELADVVAIAAGERPGERSAVAVYEQVMLARGATAINGARTDLAAPFFAWRWLESAIARSPHQGGRSTVLIATQLPEHYEQLPERAWFSEIHYLALVCDSEKIRERLRQRPA